jgi:hypothetical protein
MNHYTAIPIEDYWIIVSDQKAEKKGDVYSSGYFVDNRVCTLTTDWDYSVLPVNRTRIIIACSKELNGLPVFVPEWDLVYRTYPVRESVINIILNRVNEAFSDGFHKHEEKRLMDALHSIKELIPPDRFKEAKEKYRFTEEDILKAMDMARTDDDKDGYKWKYSFKKIIESLTKPKQYSVEIEIISASQIKIASWKEI